MKRFAILIFLLISCTQNDNKLLLYTTSSVENSGLLGYLLPHFENRTGLKIYVIAVGTGAALKAASQGNADCVITHNKKAEEDFVKEIKTLCYSQIFSNYFAIAGPKFDPAQIKLSSSIYDAFMKIYSQGFKFVSRADYSGTHLKELEIWEKIRVDPKTNPNYIRTGQTMKAALDYAFERGAYVLCDIATFADYRKKNDMMFKEFKDALNVYSFTGMNEKSLILYNWLISKEAKDMIKSFKIDGVNVFHTE